jgi:hypothetical protein
MTRLFSILGFLLLWTPMLPAQDHNWGYMANEGFENDTIKSTVFFTGNWCNGVQFYDYNPLDNRSLYTLHPDDARHLGWSESQANKDFAVEEIIEAGINLINFSYWGLPGSDNWAYWSPMQSSTQSHSELFDATLDKDILIAPFIESFASTNQYEGFVFMDDFPGTTEDPAPQFIVLIEDLIERYLVNPTNPRWPEKWAKVYDQDGNERYLFSIIHVASNNAEITDNVFSAGFDLVADKVYENTGIRIGFALDILPPDNFAPGIFKATPTATGAFLSQQKSVLAIQCFIPEIWEGESDEQLLINWKAEFAKAWINTGIPFIHDLSSGYDAHIVFPSSPIYGNNELWRHLQDSLLKQLNVNGMAFNAWNGYTEGFAAVPTLQHGDTTYYWICNILKGDFCEQEPSSFSSNQKTEYRNILEIYPNPARDFLQIHSETEETVESVALYSSCLEAVSVNRFKNTSGNNSIIIDLRHVPEGIYFISIETSTSIFIEKIILFHGPF